MIKSKLSKGLLSILFLMAFVWVGTGQLRVYGMETEVESQEEIEYTFNDVFPDRNLAIFMSRQFGYDGNVDVPITIRMLNEFLGNEGALSISSETIGNLEGLQHLTSITDLTLFARRVSNFSQVGQLTNLTRLSITNGIFNLGHLTNLTNLESLTLSANQGANLESLRHLTKLTSLSMLVHTSTTNLEPLADLTNLTNLVLHGNYYYRSRISNLEPLSNLNNLTSLNLNGHSISDLGPLSNLKNLTSLDLNNNDIVDLSPLSGLHNLTRLNLNSNDISDVEPLRSLTNLIPFYFTIQGNRISNIEPIPVRNPLALNQRITLEPIKQNEVTEIMIRNSDGNVPALTVNPVGGLYDSDRGIITWGSLGENTLSWSWGSFTGTITQYVEPSEEREKITFLDFFPDENLAQGVAEYYGRVATDKVTLDELEGRTEELILNDLGIENLEGMQYFTNLRVLRLANNGIEDLSPLSDLTHLRYLTLQNNNISDLQPLSGLSVTNLWLASNQITDIEPLCKITSLRELGLNHNQITDVSSLSGLPLTYLQLSHNRILDISSVGFVEELTATNQTIVLNDITEGEVTEEIFIKAANGQAPSSIKFNPSGGSYDLENGIITWATLGENTLTWSDVNFSGTITQFVSP